MMKCELCEKTFQEINKSHKFCSLSCSRKSYYIRNREKILDWRREYYIKNKEIIQLRSRVYASNHPEKLIEFRKKYYEENREKVLENNKKYRETHRQEVKEVICRWKKQKEIDNANKRWMKDTSKTSSSKSHPWRKKI